MDKRKAEDEAQGAEYAPTDADAEQAGDEGAEEVQEDLDDAAIEPEK